MSANVPRVLALAAAAVVLATSCRDRAPGVPSARETTTATAPRGTIRGSVRLSGRPAPNPTIWMRDDPMCGQVRQAEPPVQQVIVAGLDGGLANVFVQLVGTFPEVPVSAEPVRIDQRGCLYSPRVVGVRVGQTLRVSNSDQGVHNVHGISPGTDGFNVAQPMAGMHNDFRLRTEGILRVVCDLHPWMVAFVGVVGHPYFSVSGPDGTFEIRDVPAGSHTIQGWHERLGVVTASVRVDPDAAAAVALVYAAEARD